MNADDGWDASYYLLCCLLSSAGFGSVGADRSSLCIGLLQWTSVSSSQCCSIRAGAKCNHSIFFYLFFWKCYHLHAAVSLAHIYLQAWMKACNLLVLFSSLNVYYPGCIFGFIKTPRTPSALCMWLEHRPQCSTWSNRQMGVSHSVAVMERNYPAEYCPPSHTTSNSLDAQYSPNHSIFLVMTALSIGQDSLMHWSS